MTTTTTTTLALSASASLIPASGVVTGDTVTFPRGVVRCPQGHAALAVRDGREATHIAVKGRDGWTFVTVASVVAKMTKTCRTRLGPRGGGAVEIEVERHIINSNGGREYASLRGASIFTTSEGHLPGTEMDAHLGEWARVPGRRRRDHTSRCTTTYARLSRVVECVRRINSAEGRLLRCLGYDEWEDIILSPLRISDQEAVT